MTLIEIAERRTDLRNALAALIQQSPRLVDLSAVDILRQRHPALLSERGVQIPGVAAKRRRDIGGGDPLIEMLLHIVDDTLTQRG